TGGIAACRRRARERGRGARRASPLRAASRQVEAGVALGVRAQPVQTLQGLRNHVLRGVPSRELGRGGDVEQQRLLQSKLQLRVRQAADAAGGQRREHGGAYRPAPPATLKYVASGWWKTTAETLASGSIMQPSVSSTPISSGRRTRKRICWSSRRGQAGYPNEYRFPW